MRLRVLKTMALEQSAHQFVLEPDHLKQKLGVLNVEVVFLVLSLRDLHGLDLLL